jgi:hypothetical protein
MAVGCAETGSTWNAAGYKQSVFGYAVAYRDAKAHAMAGLDWQVDNHRRDAMTGEWQEKTGSEYMATREQDLNQDGTISTGERVEEAIFDLRLTNKRNNGVMWTKAHPFLVEQADRDLEVILDNYVDALSGNGLYAQGSMFGVERTKARNFTTFLVSKTLGRIGGRDALMGTIEIAEVDRLKQDPKHRSGVVRLVLVKIRCFTVANCRPEGGGLSTQGGGDGAVLGAGADAELKRWPTVDCRGKPCRARTGLLIVGYYNTPAYFAEGEAELDSLLGRISFPDAEPLPVPKLPAAAVAAKDETPADKVEATGEKPAGERKDKDP